jgi:hypothetical protein
MTPNQRISAGRIACSSTPPEVLVEHSGKAWHREWVSVGAWLYPGDRVELVGAAMSNPTRAKPGRKQKHPGEPLKRRCVRATDAQWSAVQRIGVERWRELAVAESQRIALDEVQALWPK